MRNQRLLADENLSLVALLKCSELRSSFAQSVAKGVALVLALVPWIAPSATAQQQSTAIDSNSVMGFETPFAWTAKSSASSMISVFSTTKRTQGSFAYAVSDAGNLVTLTSAPVSSTATALAGVGNAGALFQVDVLLPTQVGNVNNTGQMQMYVNSPSRGLSKVFVGDVLFSAFRPGIYNTLKFPIPSVVGTALGGATFSDLTFIFMVSSPGQVTGPYYFDNLRVHSVPLVTAGLNTQPPPGYGGSVDFVVFGGTPMAQTFDVGVIQVPEGFHLKLGTAGTTTVELQLGYDGTPSFTCTYGPDSTDASGKSYVLTSCTGGMQAGDLVGADWANLSIIGGDASMKIRAQLAKNPVGDTAGTGIIPAMPTFWGDFDGCAPTVVAAGVTPPFAAVANPNPPPAWIATPSATCAAQTTQINQIANNYFNMVNNGQTAPNWIVTPTPEFARRHGDASPQDILAGSPPPPSDPDFNKEGHVDQGGPFDAYWRLAGSVSTDESGSDFLTHFDSTLSGHVVVFGQDVNVVSIQAITDTDSGQVSSGSFSNPTSTGHVKTYVFGIELPPPASGDVNGTTQFQFGKCDKEAFDLPQIQVWVFVLTFGANSDVCLNIYGGLAPSGVTINVNPTAALGMHADGGIGVAGIISGSIGVEIDLLKISTPVTAGASWSIDTAPTKCDAQANFSADGQVDISSLGGEVDLVATFGPCPLCDDESWTILRWKPLLDTGFSTLFDTGQVTLAAVELPNAQSTCGQTLKVGIIGPNGAPLPASLPVPASFPLTATISGPIGAFSTSCTWSSNPGLNQGESLPTPNCTGNATLTGGGQRTIGVTATEQFHDCCNTITDTGQASATVNFVALSPGVYIYSLTPSGLNTDFVSPEQTATSINVDVQSGNGSITIVGQVIGAPASTSTTWMMTSAAGNATCSPSSALQNTYTNTTCTFTPLLSGQTATYTITMTTMNTTTQPPTLFGSRTIQANLTFPVQ